MDEAPESSFTLDSEFDELVDQDKTLEIEGFVCFLEAPTEVGEKKYNLFKFGISNGSKKIMCLAWGKELIEKLQSDVVINQIINIDGAHCKLSKYPKKLKENGYLIFEVIIRPTTKFTYKGIHAAATAVPPPVPAREVNFETILDTEGKIAIDGYIKTDFVAIPSQYQDATYGCGSITNGTYKITVNITNFQPDVNFHKGAAVRVTGEINSNRDTPTTITCRNINMITLRDGVENMPDIQLRRGGRVFKRRAEA